MRNIAIVGVGITKHVSKRRDVNIPEFVYEAVKAAIEDADIGIRDIDALVTGNMPGFEGVNCPELWGGGYWGGYKKPMLRITTGGSTGSSVAQGAFYLVASGVFDTVLTMGFEKQSDGATTVGLESAGMSDFVAMRAYGMPELDPAGAIGMFVFQAISYMARTGCTIDYFDRAAAMLRSNAAKNPYAHIQQQVTAEDIADTPMIAYPLRFGHTCPTSDGACAMIVTTKEKAQKMAKKPAWVNGWSSCAEEASIAGLHGAGSINIDPFDQRGCKFAATKAYAMAGIKEPQKEIHLAEPYVPFAHQLFLYPERLLLFNEGESFRQFDQGVMHRDGRLPICPSGGVVSSNAIGAAAMIRIAECALQIMGKAGERQVTRDVHTAVAHGLGGQANFNVVTVLGDKPAGR